MRLLLIPAVALVCSISCGCASESSRARESARLFLSALGRGDATETQKLATLAARPYLAKITPESTPSKAGFTLGETVIIKENSAEVPFLAQGDDSKSYSGAVFLRYEEKEWRVWGMRTQLTNGGELMLDFEHPEHMAGALLGAAFGELAKKLENTSKDAEKSGRALGEALGGFIKGFAEGVEKSAPQTK